MNIGDLRVTLMGLSKEELVDMIMQKAYQDMDYANIIAMRLSAKEKSPEQQIREYVAGIEEEMSNRYPSSYMIRSLTRNLRDEMENWDICDTCAACIAIIKTLDDALCNGAGMEDEEDFSITCDLEDATSYAVDRIKKADFSAEEYADVSELLNEFRAWRPGVMGTDIVESIVGAL